MQTVNSYQDSNLVEVLLTGGLAIARTDTIYGILASANNQSSVERIYQLKGRDSHKALIVLVASASDIPGLTAQLLGQYQQLSAQRPTSLIMPKTNQPSWLTRGGDSLAYRLPATKELQQLIKATGPLVAPSANPQGLVPASNIAEAIEYFGNQVDIYVDGGQVPNQTKPSRLVRIADGQINTLRD